MQHLHFSAIRKSWTKYDYNLVSKKIPSQLEIILSFFVECWADKP